MIRFLLRSLIALSLAALLGAAGLALWLSRTRVTAQDLPALRTGDIVFQESGNSQSMAIALASRSLYTHTGLIEMDAEGRATVVEAAGPVRTTPLSDWIARGTGGRITIKRVEGLSEDAARKALTAAHAYDGRPYDFYFHDDAETIYCSELVHRAFADGPGMTIGKVERVKDLHIDNAAVRGLIEARWQRHPLCAAANAADFSSCYAIILDQTLVTPAAVARDPKLTTIFSNFSFAGD